MTFSTHEVDEFRYQLDCVDAVDTIHSSCFNRPHIVFLIVKEEFHPVSVNSRDTSFFTFGSSMFRHILDRNDRFRIQLLTQYRCACYASYPLSANMQIWDT